MPSISEKTTIPSLPDAVWPMLRDPALVAACIPGATLSPDRDGDAWKGSIRVKFGPTVAVFKGEVNLDYDDAAKTITITGRGIDGRGASRALANGTVKASGTTETELQVDGEYSVTGPLETFANAGGVHVARALLAEFSSNMAKMVAERRGTASVAVPAAAPGDVAAQATMAAAALAHGTMSGTLSMATSVAATAASVASEMSQSPGVRPEGLTPSAATAQPAPQHKAAAELSASKLLWAAFRSWLRSLFGKRT